MHENQQLREKLLNQVAEDCTRIHIAFLHASPIIYEDKLRARKIAQLNFLKEEKAIKYAIKRSGYGVNYEKAVATKENFVELLSHEPFILHLSCHGFDASANAKFRGQTSDATNFLLFEDNLG